MREDESKEMRNRILVSYSVNLNVTLASIPGINTDTNIYDTEFINTETS